MSEAPERIWAFHVRASGIELGEWVEDPSDTASGTEYVRADRIEALEREVKEAERANRAMAQNGLDLANSWQSRAEAAEAREARLSEALRPFALISSEGVVKAAQGHVTITTSAEYFHRACAALSGSGSGWRLVPYLWQCKDYADGWLSFANEDEAQAYQRDTGCAVRITYRPLPAAPQQGGE